MGAGTSGGFVEPAPARDPTAPSGRALEPGARQFLEHGFARDIPDVRIHTDAAAASAARSEGTKAFTIGHDIMFGAGRYRPREPEGQRLLVHEITHVLQQTGSAPSTAAPGAPGAAAEREAASVASVVTGGGRAPGSLTATSVGVARDEPTTIEDFDPVDADTMTAAPAGAIPGLGADPDDGDAVPAAFTRTLWNKDPSVVFVPATATRIVIAKELGVQPSDFLVVGALEAPPPSEEVRGIRFTDPTKIPAPLMVEMRRRFETMLPLDVNSTVSELVAETGGWSATRFVLRWAQYSTYRDAAGASYLDRYLDGLEKRTIVTTRDYLVTESKTRRTGLEELLHQTSGDVNVAVRRARGLSGRAQPGDAAYSVSAPIPNGHVVGRWVSGRDSASAAVQVATALVSDVADRDQAEIRLRSATFLGPKVLIRSSTGGWYGYGVLWGQGLGSTFPPVVGGKEENGQFSWYYPSTMFVGGGEADSTGPAGSQQAATALHGRLLGDALAGTDNRALIALDLGAIQLATLDQRVTIFQRLVGAGFSNVDRFGYSVDLAVQALTRTLMTLPPGDFKAFARRLDQAGLTARLLATKDFRLAPLGAAFTYQTMAGTDLAAGAFANPPALTQGTANISSGLNYYLAQVSPAKDAASETTVAFEHGFSNTAWGDTNPWSMRTRTTTGSMRPTDLVSIETVGPAGRHTRMASAFEAALTQGDPKSQVEHEMLMDFLNVILLFQAGAGVMRLGGIGLRAMAAGSLRAAMQVLGEELLAQTGKAAARSIVDFALFSSARYVSAHEAELEKTPEGRAFMSTVTAATALLAVRDIGALIESGAIGRLVLTGRKVLGVVSESARVAVRRTLSNFEAARRAWAGLQAEGKVLVTTVGGVTVRRPASLDALGRAYRVSQAQVAGEELMATLGSGADAARARTSLAKLETAAGGFVRKAGAGPLTEAEASAAKAYRDVARHVNALPGAQRQGFLDALDRLLTTKGRSIEELAGFARAAVGKAGAAAPVTYLEAAGWLARDSGISRAGLARMAENAVGRSPANLGWLRTTHLTPDDLDFLARDPHTPWKSFFEAAQSPGNVSKLKIAMRGMRGHAAEMVARDEAVAGRLVPGYRVQGRQVTAGTSEIDFQLISTDRLGRLRPMEVKGWTPGTWRRSLDAYKRDPTARSLVDSMDIAGSRSVGKMMKQLDDAASITARGELPVLAVTQKMAAADRAALEALVKGKAEVVYLPEAAITTASGRLRTAMDIK